MKIEVKPERNYWSRDESAYGYMVSAMMVAEQVGDQNDKRKL